MDFFVKTCIALSVIALALFLGWLAFKIKRAIETRVLLKAQKRSLTLVHKILEVNYSPDYQLHCVVFPYDFSPNSKLFFTDAILVTRGGVLIIAMRDLHGSIDNPYRNTWRQFYRKVITNLANPLEQLEAQKIAIDRHLKSRNITNVPIYKAVVYIDPHTSFKINDIPEIVPVEKIVPHIHDINKDVMLKRSEMHSVADALRKISSKPRVNPSRNASR